MKKERFSEWTSNWDTKILTFGDHFPGSHHPPSYWFPVFLCTDPWPTKQNTCSCLGINMANQFSSVAQSYLILCNPKNCSTPGFPVHHQLLELAQTHVHQVGDAIQPSNPVTLFSSHLQSFPSSGSFQMSQFFTSGGQSIGISASPSVLPMNIQDWFPLGWTGWISLLFKGLSRVISNTTVQKHQSFSTQLSSQSNSHIHTWPLEKPEPWPDKPLLA